MNEKDLIEQLTRHEGCELMPYRDTEGLLTIGIGRCIDRIGISREEAEHLLKNDLMRVKMEIHERAPWIHNLDDVRRNAFLNMAFNLGTNGLLKFQKALSHAREARWDECASEMLDSKWARQVGNRAKELAEQVRTGVYTC
jgi:lysozyme